MIRISLETMFANHKCLVPKYGMYVIEDLHTMVMDDYMKSSQEITHNIIAEAYIAMHANYCRGCRYSKHHTFNPLFKKQLWQMYLFDSMMILVKNTNVGSLHEILIGKDSFANNELNLNPAGTYY
jgi:hypothetical protein